MSTTPPIDVRPSRATGCVSRLARGQYKRLPADHPEPIGWYIACPVCKLVTVVLAEVARVREVEGALVEMAPFRCSKCHATYAIRGGRFARCS